VILGNTPDTLMFDFAVVMGQHMPLGLDRPPRNLGVCRL
jgi:hypothetical protein